MCVWSVSLRVMSCRRPFKGDKGRVFAVSADLAHGKDVSFAVCHPDPAHGKGICSYLFFLLRNFCLISVSNIV